MCNSSLHTENLKVGYGKKVVIDDITIEAVPGKILTLIGPNGSGKSTVLKTLVRQLDKLSGKIVIAGTDEDKLSEKELARKMSMVMTERLGVELMTCRDMVATGRYPYTGLLGILSDEDKRKVNEAISIVNAREVADEDFGSISDGQRQRVMLARAICQEPEILVLDEPTSYLDIKYKLDILNSIRRLAREKNIAVIMSLHEVDLALKISDYIATVKAGKIKSYGSPEELYGDMSIQQLYGIGENEFDSLTGRIQFVSEKNDHEPKVFVIAGGGSGIPVFYKLFRDGVSFATGIIPKNDVDYAEAMALSSECIYTEAFMEVSDEELNKAKALIDKCEKCICRINSFGPYNMANKVLYEYAKSKNKCE